MSRPKVKVFALSTCGWCRKTVEWLNSNQVVCDIIYTDQISGEERRQVIDEMNKFNPRGSFPTIVIDDGREVIIGFRPDELERAILK